MNVQQCEKKKWDKLILSMYAVYWVSSYHSAMHNVSCMVPASDSRNGAAGLSMMPPLSFVDKQEKTYRLLAVAGELMTGCDTTGTSGVVAMLAVLPGVAQSGSPYGAMVVCEMRNGGNR
jgi:hypothetical protein